MANTPRVHPVYVSLNDKRGEVGVVLAVDGVDDECLDADARDRVARRFETTLRLFDDHTRLLQSVLKRPRIREAPHAYADGRVQILLTRRHRFVTRKRTDV